MTSFFATAFAATDPLRDSVFGEAFAIAPQAVGADVNARRIADVTRPAATITGVWTDPHVRIFPHNRTRHPDADSARIADDRPTMDFVTAALPYRLVIGDRVRRVADGTWFEVSDPGDGELSRTTVALTARRSA